MKKGIAFGIGITMMLELVTVAIVLGWRHHWKQPVPTPLITGLGIADAPVRKIQEADPARDLEIVLDSLIRDVDALKRRSVVPEGNGLDVDLGALVKDTGRFVSRNFIRLNDLEQRIAHLERDSGTIQSHLPNVAADPVTK